ncbi:MAG TPA: FtsK/SpoIIIE domain-containing protein [Lamprocystis sp. (in: g-proteobacteria)]|nr:FtsK/SpoIIIE domain-containing protein [Lamprocystis sp. (in: g-proteobacteria)]
MRSPPWRSRLTDHLVARIALPGGEQLGKLAEGRFRARSLAPPDRRSFISGKSAIGIEIPNEESETARLSEIPASAAYQDSKSPLSLALGTNIAGEPLVVDLARMPHALIAGTTGSGKSVAINAMVLSLVSMPDGAFAPSGTV